MAVDMIANMYLGTFAKHGATAIKLVPKEYIVGALALEVDKANKTMSILPNTAVGASIVEIKPPTSLLFRKPAAQEGTNGADAAKAAPRVCPEI
jgi:hypothetical protein